MWQLFICIGVSWLGCGAQHTVPYQSEEACYKALDKMRVSTDVIAESDNKRSFLAYCAEIKR